MNKIPQSCAALKNWSSTNPPKKEDIQKCVKDIEAQGYRPSINISERNYDKNYAVLREPSSYTSSSSLRITFQTSPSKIAKVASFCRGSVGKIGKKVSDYLTAFKRVLPTIEGTVRDVKNGDLNFTQGSYNICVDLPTFGIEFLENASSLLPEKWTKPVSNRIIGDAAYSKVTDYAEDKISNFCAQFYKPDTETQKFRTAVKENI